MMAVESSSLSQDLISRNREGSESKKKLKKTRSIKLLSKVPSLKPSSRKSKSRFNWLSIDLLTDASSVVDFPDSLPNYMKATSSSDAKKDSSQQGGSEIDDVTSVGSSSYGSLVNGLPSLNQATRIQKMMKTYGSSRSFRRRAKSRIVQPSIVSSNDAATPQRPPSAEVSNGSLNYLKATSSPERRKVNSQASPGNSESSFDSSDQSSLHDSKSKSGSSSQKSLQTLVRTPSVRIIKNKTSFKPKRSSLKCSPISEDLNVDRATCSSILKGKKFPHHVEFHSEPTEAYRIATMKVCPYHHCSLHGHRHDPAPPPKRSLYKKRRSLKSQKNVNSVKESTSGLKLSGSGKKDFPVTPLSPKVDASSQEIGASSTVLSPLKDDKDMSFSIEIYAKLTAHVPRKADGETEDAKAVEIPLGESSYHGESHQENLNHMMCSLVKTISDLQEKSARCCCKTELHNSSLVSAEVDSEVHEVTASNIGDEDQESTIEDGNADHSIANLPDLHVKPDDQVRSENDANLNGESWQGETSTLAGSSDDFDEAIEDKSMSSSALDHKSLDDLKTSPGEKTSDSGPEDMYNAGPTPVGGSDGSKFILDGDSESTAASHEGNRAQVNKDKHISMWHLIHKHMASSLASDSDTKPLLIADEEKKVDDISILPAPTVSETTQNSSDLNTRTENHDAVNQDIELRNVFAIKLVREAIEKILLPEVPDQSSDDQSVTSDAMSEQDLSEKNHDEECAEDSKREFDKRKGDNNASAALKEAGCDGDNIFGPEKEQTETRLEKKSDKKAPKHWSNLKKWILLQRFIKALEKVGKFNPSKPQHLQLEPDAEAEKVSLRHQTTEDRKRAEEWMLDYALRQAISQLAPTQKKKVALLVKAFETVVPPQEDSGIHLTFSKLKETSDESPYSTKDVDESVSQRVTTTQEAHETLASGPGEERNLITDNTGTIPSLSMVSASQLLNNVSSKSHDILSSSPEKLAADEKQKQDILETDAPEESLSKSEECEYLRGGTGMPLCTTQGSSSAFDGESAISSEITSSVSENISLKNSITSSRETNEESKVTDVNLETNEDTTTSHNSEFPSIGSVSIKNTEINAASGEAGELSFASKLTTRDGNEKSATIYPADCSFSDTIEEQRTAEEGKNRESSLERTVLQGFYLMDSKSDVNENEEDQKSYIRMWHMVYQHVVSNIAEKVGSKLLDGADDETEDANKFSEYITNQDAGNEKCATSLGSGFSRSEAIKLVQEAVDEILLPEIQDHSSETESVISDIVPDQELREKNHTEAGEENTSYSPELTKDDLRKMGNREGVNLLDQEGKGLTSDSKTNQEDKRTKSLAQTKSEPPKPKNWSKLKRLILLKRSIKALEKARNLKSQIQKDLPLTPNPESEKVDLRHQMMDEKKKAEQWMLDYAVQHIVNKLTPARKRRVAMLVEAFEAVVPLPEI